MDQVRDITLKRHPFKKYPIQVGDTARAHIKVKEGSKERVQVFEGVILKIQGKDHTRSFTIRKISGGVGVEKTLPLASPYLSHVEVVSRSKVRRARLYYLRKLKGRAARLSARQLTDNKDQKQEKPS
ncbi:MAG: 50S ribosomal protein L19 [Bdellovibrionales bacterium]|nr:50S ribosomal protein L19 [Bdellovibrionales bacterium]